MNIAITVAEEPKAREDNADALRCAVSVMNALKRKKHTVTIIPIYESDFKNDARYITHKISPKTVDCVFNLFEGFSHDAEKEIQFAEILEKRKIPFTGNKSRALAACLNKVECKKILATAGLPVPWGMHVTDIQEVSVADMMYPVFVKPLTEDASVGIDDESYCINKKQLMKVLPKKLAAFPKGVLVETFISGREYSVSFVGDKILTMLAISVIDYNEYTELLPFLTYASKWDRQSREFQQIKPHVLKKPAQKLVKIIQEMSCEAAHALGCSGYFRIDFREMDGTLYIIDVNPNPDINEDAGFVKQAHAAGYSYDDIVALILQGENA